MSTNIDIASRVIRQLLASGVKEFCLCAGARNSPFVQVFSENEQIKVFHFFEERSAAFFALGRMASTRRPMAVVTTSGTAAAELLPAAVEGTYSSLPLILITADRPKKYRWSGAPQSIEQVGLFSYYIEVSFDLDEQNSHFSLNGLSWKKPIHVNVCFKEPLLDGEIPKIEVPARESRTRFPESFPLNMPDEIQNFLATYHPLVVVSTLPDKARPSVLEFLKSLKAPLYLEGISGLRGHPELKEYSLQSGEKFVAELFDRGHCNAIIRIGGVPTLRFWRDLEDKRENLPVLSIGYNHFTGLSRHVLHFSDLVDLPRMEIERTLSEDIPFARDRRMREHCVGLMNKYPRSEPALVGALSKHLKDSSVYLGNSLPVREWDLAADFDGPPRRVVGSRGANGIDGQVSTFLGWSRPETENWCLVGDLTALYDLSSLWITDQLESQKHRIVVINNQGGMIFQKMFGKEIFLNRHSLNFSGWANLWGWNYRRWEDIPSDLSLGPREIIEVVPDEKQSLAFWKEWDESI